MTESKFAEVASVWNFSTSEGYSGTVCRERLQWGSSHRDHSGLMSLLRVVYWEAIHIVPQGIL